MKIQASEKGEGLKLGNYIGVITGINKVINERQGQMLVSFNVNIDGRTHRSKLYQTEGKGQFFLQKALTALGVKELDLEAEESGVRGIKAEFTYGEREWNGTKYRDLEPVRAIGRATEEQLAEIEGEF